MALQRKIPWSLSALREQLLQEQRRRWGWLSLSRLNGLRPMQAEIRAAGSARYQVPFLFPPLLLPLPLIGLDFFVVPLCPRRAIVADVACIQPPTRPRVFDVATGRFRLLRGPFDAILPAPLSPLSAVLTVKQSFDRGSCVPCTVSVHFLRLIASASGIGHSRASMRVSRSQGARRTGSATNSYRLFRGYAL